VSDLVTRLFVAAPWLAGLLWLVLHGADFALTLKGARLRAELFARTGTVEQGPYELNPMFRADVAKLRPFPPRFVATWVGGALAWPLLLRAVRFLLGGGPLDETTAWLLGAMLGALVFTRVAIIGRHLRNLYLFDRMLRPRDGGPPRAPVQLDLKTNLFASAIALAEGAVLLGVAAALSWDAWATGGAVALALVAVKHAALAHGTR